ncbi:MAG: von Willebrand factor type A domain-containing protein, partial [Oscillospiraceae bacterium]|nr:von Willebrand factor type A domain-containing protein [Oscillospiraceae bacterium]
MTTMMTGCGGSLYERKNASLTAENGNALQHQNNDIAYEMAADYSADEDNGEDNGLEWENSEEYTSVPENDFVLSAENPLSTFSADVDTASYSNVRRMIQSGLEVAPEAVRIEEMINYFSYDYPEPTDGAPLSVTTEMYDCPWNTDNQLFLIGMQAEKIDLEGRPPMNLTFLIDVSGSMYAADKLPLVQKAVAMLAEELNENDRVSIVTYAGEESVVLEGASGSDYALITDAIYSLSAGGATAGERGILKAYEIAQQYYIEGGNNRVLLATDGDLNVGLSSAEELTALVEEKRESGVSLSVLGFGTGNLKDDRLEALADNGNGNYAYIDSELEARKVLVQEMGGTLYTVAK